MTTSICTSHGEYHGLWCPKCEQEQAVNRRPAALHDIHNQQAQERPSPEKTYRRIDPPTFTPAPTTTFDSGAQRSVQMPLYSAIPTASLRRLALRATGTPKGDPPYADPVTGFTYRGGSRGYGYGNWKLGLPCEDTFNHVVQHLLDWKAVIEKGELPAEDDLAGVAWGVMLPLMTFEARYREQYKIRKDLMEANRHTSAEDIDNQMRARLDAYLLRPLAAERSTTQESKPKNTIIPPPRPLTCMVSKPNIEGYRMVVCDKPAGHVGQGDRVHEDSKVGYRWS